MRLRRQAFIFLSVLVMCSQLFAAEPEPADVSKKIDSLFSKHRRPDAPGVAVAVVQNGEVVYRGGFGAANLDHAVPISSQTVFDVGSVSKSFTCACVALLLDQGRISPDDDLRRYVPEMHQFDPPVKIRHLIRCRSGIWAQWHIKQLAGWASEPVEAPYSRNDLLTLLSGQTALPFPPGSRFQYGTSDYFLLALIVERVSGHAFAEFARQNLFEPLGMRQTFFMDDPARVVRHRATGYYRDLQQHWKPWQQAASAVGGSGLHTSIDDLVRWERNFSNNRLPSGKHFDEFISQGTLLNNRNVLDAHPVESYRGLRRMQFTGGMPGFNAAITRFPEQNFATICLSNNSDISAMQINAHIADVCLAKTMKPVAPSAKKNEDSVKPNETELDPPDLHDLVGAYRLRNNQRVWTISLNETKLQVTDHMRQRHQIRQLGGNQFRPIGDFFEKNSQFIFERKSPDEKYSIRYQWEGGAVTLDPIELVVPREELLREYAGRYYSEQLATIYRFEVREGQLHLRVNNRGWEPLDPTVQDEFIPAIRQPHDNRILRFSRDDRGAVSGVNVSLWRVKDVSFRKIE